jgi:hypothetical protein
MASWVELASAPRWNGREKPGVRILRSSFLQRLVVVLVCLGAVAAGNPAQALLVGPGDSVEVTFAFTTPPNAGGNAIDLLVLTTTPFTASGPGITVNASLYDGAALLGSGIRPSAALISFSDGLYTNAIAANLDSVRTGAIDGRIVFTPNFADDAGFIDFDPDNFDVRGAHGFTSSVILASPGAAIRSVEIPVAQTPVPPALLLFASALAALGIALYRRRPRSRMPGAA